MARSIWRDQEARTWLTLWWLLQSQVAPIAEHSAASQFHAFNLLGGNETARQYQSSWYRTPIVAPGNMLLCITACCRHDGFGAAFMSHIAVFVYSRLAGIDFCSTPWGNLQHGVDGRTMFNFIGGAFYGPHVSPFKPNQRGITVLQANRIMQYPYSARRDLPFVASVRYLVRRHYFSSTDERPRLRFFDSANRNVAIHVRRGDIMDTQLFGKKYDFRRIPDESYVSCVSAILSNATENAGSRQGSPAKPFAFHLFSDGQKHDLGTLAKIITDLNPTGPPTELHEKLKGANIKAATDDLKVTFHHLVSADVQLRK